MTPSNHESDVSRRGEEESNMRDCVVRLGVLVLAGVVLAGSVHASGSYGGAGFTPPKTKKDKPAESSKPKKKKTSDLGVVGASHLAS
jgi:hypothetical protein